MLTALLVSIFINLSLLQAFLILWSNADHLRTSFVIRLPFLLILIPLYCLYWFLILKPIDHIHRKIYDARHSSLHQD